MSLAFVETFARKKLPVAISHVTAPFVAPPTMPGAVSAKPGPYLSTMPHTTSLDCGDVAGTM